MHDGVDQSGSGYHAHEHTHTSEHSHLHTHTGEHSHTHPGLDPKTVHAHEHTHLVVHDHDHAHEGDHTHPHDSDTGTDAEEAAAEISAALGQMGHEVAELTAWIERLRQLGRLDAAGALEQALSDYTAANVVLAKCLKLLNQ